MRENENESNEKHRENRFDDDVTFFMMMMIMSRRETKLVAILIVKMKNTHISYRFSHKHLFLLFQTKKPNQQPCVMNTNDKIWPKYFSLLNIICWAHHYHQTKKMIKMILAIEFFCFDFLALCAIEQKLEEEREK